jgi:hypothetical protein
MIEIKFVEEKETRNGKPYKRLELDSGKFVSMWSDDPDYSLAMPSTTLEREVHYDGKYYNLLPKGASAPIETKSQTSLEDINTKLNVMYAILQEIGKKVGCEMKDSNRPEVEEEMDPENIPF